MTTSLKLRRGTTAQHTTFTGAEGEVTIDTTKDTVVVHDGATAGGFPLAKEKFTQTGTGAVVRTVDEKIREVLSVKDFGAVGDGIADDTSAIQAAINAANAATQTSTNAFYGTSPTVYFPRGKYKISAALTYYRYSRFLGDRAFLTQSTVGQDIFFSNTPYQNEFKGLIFELGAVQIHCQNGTTGGLEGVLVHVEDCEFYLSTGYSIKCTKTGTPLVGGEYVSITNCRAYNFAQFLYSRFDMTTLENTYLYTSAAEQPVNSAWINVGVNANLKNLVFVPAGGYVAAGPGYRYIDNYTEGALVVTGCRFGSEDGGLPLVYNFTNALSELNYPYQGGGAIILENNPIFSTGVQSDAGAIVAKSGLPKFISIKNNSQGAIGPFVNTNQLTGGGSLTSYFAGAAAEPYLQISIKNNGVWGGLATLTSSTTDTALLRPYMEYTIPEAFSKLHYIHRLETKTLRFPDGGSPVNGTASSKQISDYEEGSWTPLPIPTSGAYTTITASGSYVKTGKMLCVSFDIVFNNVGTATNCDVIRGLPYAAKNLSGQSGSGSFREYNVTGNLWSCTVLPGTTEFITRSYANGSNVSNTFRFTGSFTYIV